MAKALFPIARCCCNQGDRKGYLNPVKVASTRAKFPPKRNPPCSRRGVLFNIKANSRPSAKRDKLYAYLACPKNDFLSGIPSKMQTDDEADVTFKHSYELKLRGGNDGVVPKVWWIQACISWAQSLATFNEMLPESFLQMLRSLIYVCVIGLFRPTLLVCCARCLLWIELQTPYS